MSPAKQDTDKKINCNFCSNKYAHKGSLTTHIKSKHKEDTETLKIYDMTKAIVEEVCNDVMTIRSNSFFSHFEYFCWLTYKEWLNKTD